MKIRPFETGDQPSVVSLWERCGLTVPWNDPFDDIECKLTTQPELFLVAVENMTVIGTAMGGYDGHRGWLYYLAVDPQYRGRGFGTGLVETVAGRLRDLGCPKLNIMVRASNREMVSFYEKCGFVTDDVICMGNRLS